MSLLNKANFQKILITHKIVLKLFVLNTVENLKIVLYILFILIQISEEEEYVSQNY